MRSHRSLRTNAIVISEVFEITHTMPVGYFESSAHVRLLELVRLTKRYSICEVEAGHLEVTDDRCLLDHLLQFSELRPTTNDLLEIDFEETLEQLSPGPTLSRADHTMLAFLTMQVEVLDPEAENTAYIAAYDRACVLRGTFRQVEHFLMAALDHRVQ